VENRTEATMEKTLVFLMIFVPMILPVTRPEPETFWNELIAVILLGALLICARLQKLP